MNAADEGQVKNAEKKHKTRRERELNDICAVLATVQGRRFFWRYLEITKVLSECFNPSGSVTNFNLGQRNIGLQLLSDIDEAQPEAYVTMRREAKQEEKNQG